MVKEFHSTKTTLFKLEDMEIINLNGSNMNSPKAISNEKPDIYVNGTQKQIFSNKSIPSQQEIKEENDSEQKRLYEELVFYYHLFKYNIFLDQTRRIL